MKDDDQDDDGLDQMQGEEIRVGVEIDAGNGFSSKEKQEEDPFVSIQFVKQNGHKGVYDKKYR